MKDFLLEIKENFSYWIAMTLLSSLLFFNYSMSSDTVALFCTIIYCIYVLRCKEEFVLPSMVHMSLFGYLFTYNSFNLLFFVSFSFIVRTLIITKTKFSNISLLLVGYLVTHIISTNIGNVNLFLLATFLSLFSVLFASLIIDKTNIGILKNSYLLSFFLSSIFGFYKDSTRLMERFDVDEAFEMLRYSGLSYDANFYTVIAIVAICVVVHNIKTDGKLINYIVLAGIVFLGMQTLSKSFYLCASVLVFYSLLVSKSKKKYAIFLAIGFFAVLPFIMDKILPLLEVMNQRLDRTQDASSFSTGRTDLWKMYYNNLFGTTDGLFFGHGAVLPKGMEAAHNTYLELLFKFGIIGTIFDFILLSKSFQLVRKKIGKISIETFVYIGALALLLFNLSSYTFLSLWACLLMIMVVSTEQTQKIAE